MSYQHRFKVYRSNIATIVPDSALLVYAGRTPISPQRLTDAKNYAELSGYRYLLIFDYSKLTLMHRLNPSKQLPLL